MLFCTYSEYIYKISLYKLTSTRRDGGLFELLECVQPIRSRVWTLERFKTKTNDRNVDEDTAMSSNEQIMNTSIRCEDYTISEEAVFLVALPVMLSNALENTLKKCSYSL